MDSRFRSRCTVLRVCSVLFTVSFILCQSCSTNAHWIVIFSWVDSPLSQQQAVQYRLSHHLPTALSADGDSLPLIPIFTLSNQPLAKFQTTGPCTNPPKLRHPKFSTRWTTSQPPPSTQEVFPEPESPPGLTAFGSTLGCLIFSIHCTEIKGV